MRSAVHDERDNATATAAAAPANNNNDQPPPPLLLEADGVDVDDEDGNALLFACAGITSLTNRGGENEDGAGIVFSNVSTTSSGICASNRGEDVPLTASLVSPVEGAVVV